MLTFWICKSYPGSKNESKTRLYSIQQTLETIVHSERENCSPASSEDSSMSVTEAERDQLDSSSGTSEHG